MNDDLRAIFDSACGEYLGGKESIKQVSLIMDRDKKTFEQVLISYISSIDDHTERMYWLEGLFHSLYNMLPCKEVNNYILSYSWENLFLYKPFNKRGYPFYYWQSLLERMFHRLVDRARTLK